MFPPPHLYLTFIYFFFPREIGGNARRVLQLHSLSARTAGNQLACLTLADFFTMAGSFSSTDSSRFNYAAGQSCSCFSTGVGHEDAKWSPCGADHGDAERTLWEQIAGIKRKARQAALSRQPSTHARAHPPICQRMCMCCNPVCVSHSLSPSFIPLAVICSPPSFVHSANPTHLRTCAYPPAHAVGTALSLHKTAQFHAGLCKEMLKSVRYLCLMVSPWQLREQSPAMLCRPQRILNLDKEELNLVN